MDTDVDIHERRLSGLEGVSHANLFRKRTKLKSHRLVERLYVVVLLINRLGLECPRITSLTLHVGKQRACTLKVVCLTPWTLSPMYPTKLNPLPRALTLTVLSLEHH